MVKQFAKYCLVGLANTALGLTVIYLAMGAFSMAPGVANAAGFAVAFLASYWLNRRWTFQSTTNLGRSLTTFAVICAAGYALNLTAVLTAINVADLNAYFAQLIGVAIYAVFVFTGSRFFAFRT